ncbi:DUF397 domain-containing protein [Streptomyces sp. URMC 126]|uniref:DUF397 domain-containing protein n=1 Tax=Streptomyces sp. URMC 126 TaxID=3423401 RepID=UPI003F1D5392
MCTVRFDLSIASWRKSSYSAGNETCIEVAEQFPGVLPIRDSKTPDRPPIVVPRAAWSAFVTAVAAANGDLA